jgi:hypothetical protein
MVRRRASLAFDLVGVRPRQGLVLAGVGFDLGAVQRDVPEPEQRHLTREHQHLHEQRLDLLEKAPPERRQRVVYARSRLEVLIKDDYFARLADCQEVCCAV